ncbi:photosynthetic reaction center subunit H [uncultured Rhodospira sp.]|mgnify:CR=1 FL=1|uniref:photosynthetic reaction center subunit H n=1 Tax=uncultured Rhodospira sp. TaxID=1936189 RepID=UPI002628569D|nr:photosynthetic reaction center subunit H [uncultured Rhodospira sp.]
MELPIGALTAYMDVAQVALWTFWLFFFGLVFYLRREDRREGYPLEYDTNGRIEKTGWFWIPKPKTFNLYHGGTVMKPDYKRDTRPVKARRAHPWSGSPFVPTGANPLADCVGPSAYSQREDKPELSMENTPKIVPMRTQKEFFMEKNSPDPRGLKVMGNDGKFAGTVSDIWVDVPEIMVRYLEVELSGGAKPAPKASAEGAPAAPPKAKTVLLPINFADIWRREGYVKVDALRADQIAQVPATAKPNQVTKLEEDKICAFYGGGFFFAQS